MTAIVIIAGKRAVMQSYQWSCDDKNIERALNGMLSPFGPSGADPNPDYHAAEAAVKVFGGSIVSFDETEYEEGVIY